MLHRLVKKKALAFERDGKKYLYLRLYTTKRPYKPRTLVLPSYC